MAFMNRKSWLGRYSCDRKTWYQQYRLARIGRKEDLNDSSNRFLNSKKFAKIGGTMWKANLIVSCERIDKPLFNTREKLEALRMINEILKDQNMI